MEIKKSTHEPLRAFVSSISKSAMLLTTKIIIGFISSLNWITSLFLIKVIESYLRSKPLGYQTVLDLVSIDNGRVITLTLSIYYIDVYLPLFFDDFKPEFIIFLVISCHVLSLLFCSSMLVTVVIRSVLIFHGEIIHDIPDGKILGLTRLASILLALTAAGLDHLTGGNHHFAMNILHKDLSVER